MLAAPSAAIDLPLRILVSEDSAGDVWPCYNSPGYIQSRHGFPQELAQSIAGIADLAKIASE